MPFRNGRIVDWKIRVNEWAEVLNSEDEDEVKLIKLAGILDKHPAIFGEEDFSERLRDAAEEPDEGYREYIGNSFIGEVYDFADERLIWMGM